MSDLQTKIAAVPYWYHRIELPGGVVTPGWAPLNPQFYGVPESLMGQRILDVGTWDGYWSFEALRRGAIEVIAIDDFSDFLGSQEVPRAKWQTFDLCREALGWTEAELKRREMSVYDVGPHTLGMFDSVFFFGTLYHLRHPLLALDKLASVCLDTIYIETAICDDYSAYRGMGKGYSDQMVMEFYPGAEYGENATNWWAPSLKCLGQMVRAAGFSHVEVWKIDRPNGVPRCRGFARGRRSNPAEGEGRSPSSSNNVPTPGQ